MDIQRSWRCWLHSPVVRAALAASALVLVIMLLEDSAIIASGEKGQRAYGPSSKSAPVCESVWNDVGMPADAQVNHINDTVALSPTDVWAVGDRTSMQATPGDQGPEPLMMHWDGSNWKIIPNPPSQDGTVMHGSLLAVSAQTTDDVWALGDAGVLGVGGVGGAYHWNGYDVEWTPILDPYGYHPTLRDIAVVGNGEVWAVGRGGNVSGYASNTVTMHYDGHVWSLVPSPNGVAHSNNGLEAVAALPSGEAWAVGSTHTGGGYEWVRLLMHWPAGGQGTWTLFQNTPGQYTALHDVAALSPDDVWVVGEHTRFRSAPSRNLAMHYDGTGWTELSPPDQGTSDNALWAMALQGAGDLWAVGSTAENYDEPHLQAAHRWNNEWQQATVPTLPNLLDPSSLSVSALGTGGDDDANGLWATARTRAEDWVDPPIVSEQFVLRYGCAP